MQRLPLQLPLWSGEVSQTITVVVIAFAATIAAISVISAAFAVAAFKVAAAFPIAVAAFVVAEFAVAAFVTCWSPEECWWHQ